MTAETLSEQIQGNTRNRIIRQFVTNTAVYPFFDAIRVISTVGLITYITELPHYLLFMAAGIQAWFLGRRAQLPWTQQALGNLIAPIIYTIIDTVLEGWGIFWSEPNHWIYWIFSLGMALFYALEGLLPQSKKLLILLMNLWRVLLFPAIYAISELDVELETISWANLTSYFLDSSGHLFILLASLMFGLLLGFREIQLDHYLILLRRIATRLQQVSEWSLSPEMLAESMADETALQQRRVQRTVLFMDIRGFTKWSESKSPEAVVTMLNQFYGHAEEIISTGGGMKPHFIGDEVMTWFEAPQKAVETAVSLQQIINKQLEPVGLSVGIGIHQGEVVEGLLGSSTTKQYDIIGDAVNTASRLMAAAASKQLLVSETVMPASRLPGNATPITLQVKGKSQPLQAYALAGS